MSAVQSPACPDNATGHEAAVALDVTRLVRRMLRGRLPTGIDRVALEYVRHYGPRARALVSESGFSLLLSARGSRRVFDLLLERSAGGGASLRREFFKSMAKALLTGSKRIPDTGMTLLHTCHSGLEFPRYFQSLRRRGIRTVTLIHDLIPLTHPEHCRPETEALHRRRIRTLLTHADGVITNSAATLLSLRAEAELARLPLPPATVAPLGCGFAANTSAKPILDARPFFVMLGTIEARKNHWFILQVWRAMVEQIGAAAPKLIVIGQRGWECESALDMLDRCPLLRGVVIEEAHCADERLAAYLRGCRALLFPSFAEGYGMPLAEALSAGVPVIASDLPVFREIGADIPEFLDPLDGPRWRTMIAAYAEHDSFRRAAQIDRMRGFAPPTWQAHFEIVDRFLGERQAPPSFVTQCSTRAEIMA